MSSRLTYANVMSTLAMFIALGGASYAAIKLPANSVGSAQIKKNAVAGAKVRDGSLTGADVADRSLGVVDLAEPEQYHEVGGGDEPTFGNGWKNISPDGVTATTGFYKDPFGVVHLKGTIASTREDGGFALIIFRLPDGYRPTRTVCMSAWRIAAALVCVDPTGAVSQEGGQAAGDLSLDGVTFRAGAG